MANIQVLCDLQTEWVVRPMIHGAPMAEDTALSKGVEALNRYFLGDATMLETLTRVAEAARLATPQAESVGITMMVDGKPGTYVFTDPEIPEVDRAQYQSGRGPCIDAWRDGNVYGIEDTRADTRWPEFSSVANQHGIRSTLSIPMIASERTLGAMNLYATARHAFDANDQRTVQLFASQAAFLLANAQASWDARSLSENLVEALKSRAVIEQAKGIIMGAQGCTPEEAFETLVRQSQHENAKLRDIAAELVRNAGRRRP